MLHTKISTVTACIHYCVENSTKCSKVRQTNKRQESTKKLQEISNKWILQSCRIQTRSIYKNQFYFYILAMYIGKWNLKIYRLHKHDILKGKCHKICARPIHQKLPNIVGKTQKMSYAEAETCRIYAKEDAMLARYQCSLNWPID